MFHRAQFLEALTRHLDPDVVTLHFAKRLASYETPKFPGESVKMTLTDGSTVSADVVIGCDGVWSAARRSLLEHAAADVEAGGAEESTAEAAKLRSAIEPLWSGWYAYRSVVAREKVEALPNGHRVFKNTVMVSNCWSFTSAT